MLGTGPSWQGRAGCRQPRTGLLLLPCRESRSPGPDSCLPQRSYWLERMCISGSGNPKKGKEAFLHFSYEKIKAQERQTGKNSGFGVRSFGFPPCHPSRTSELLSASMSSSLKWEYDDPPCQRTVLRIRGDLAWEDER